MNNREFNDIKGWLFLMINKIDEFNENKDINDQTQNQKGGTKSDCTEIDKIIRTIMKKII